MEQNAIKVREMPFFLCLELGLIDRLNFARDRALSCRQHCPVMLMHTAGCIDGHSDFGQNYRINCEESADTSVLKQEAARMKFTISPK